MIKGSALAAACAVTLVSLTNAFAQETFNAADVKYGAGVSMQADPKVVFNRGTSLDDAIDGNVHSRPVFTGTPYTLTIDLFKPVMIENVAITSSDYGTETSPKDIVIELDDGTKIEHTLQDIRPEKKKPAWQEVPVGKTSGKVRVTVNSVYQTTNNWGGVGDIAVNTKENLDETFALPAYDKDAPTFVHAPPVQADASGVKVTLPPQVKPGVFPRTIMASEEIAGMKKDAESSERGKQALALLIARADTALNDKIEFPDPNGPLAQVKSRGDEPAKAHDKLSFDAGNLARAYAFTGDEKYADKAAEILVGYAERYEKYPDHKGVNRADTGKVMGQRLSEAMWLIPIIQAYDLIHDSKALDDTQRSAIEEDLIRACVDFIWRKSSVDTASERDARNPGWRTSTPPAPEPRKPVGNWLNFYNSATMLAGAVLDDKDMMDVAAANFREMIRNGIGDDGMWGEGAVGYQFFAINGMMPGLETAARHGYDLWSFDDGRFKMLFDSPRIYAYPDGSMPGINDSSRVRGGGWTDMVYDYAYDRYGDERYAGILNNVQRQLHFTQGVYVPTRHFGELPELPKIKYPSTIFANLGYATIRDDDTYALMDYGRHGGVHGHFDKLNLILFGMGDELGGEPKFHPYEDHLHGEWVRETVAHNTMAVDRHSQTASEGKLLAYELSPDIKLMRGMSDESSPGALLDRTVVLMPGMVMDVYSGRASFDRTWERTLRYAGDLTEMASSGGESEMMGVADGFEHIKKAGEVSAADGWQGTWVSDRGDFRVHVAGAKGQKVLTGTDPDDAELALVRQEGKSADVGVVYQTAAGGPAATATMADTGNDKVIHLQAKAGDASADLIVNHGADKWSTAGWESDAQVLVLRQADGKQQLLLTGATFARHEGKEIKLDARGNASATMSNGKWTIDSQWSPEK